MHKLLCAFLLLLICITPAFAAEEIDLLLQESIGPLRIGMPQAEVESAVVCPVRGVDELWGADGAWHQKWGCADGGVTLDLAGDAEKAPKQVTSITVTSPCVWATKRGITIGSTEQEVMVAYKDCWNKEESEATQQFVAGSVYGGLIFTFEKGKVKGIFLGAAAE